MHTSQYNSSEILITQTSVQDPKYLCRQTHWIRDELDPQVARDGPDALHSDDILNLDELLRVLLVSELSLDIIQRTRIDLAILDIIGRATRWPRRIIERCETIQDSWNARYGPSNDDDLTENGFAAQWLTLSLCDQHQRKARRFSNLGFSPGQWWINHAFACQDGIVDTESKGGITFDAKGAYAVVLTGDDEIENGDAENFVYRTKLSTRGRYRLTSGSPESRQPVRILRSHALKSLWAPRAGIRYEGLYRIGGWTVSTSGILKSTIEYSVRFERLGDEIPMSLVMSRPRLIEVEKYDEYTRQKKTITIPIQAETQTSTSRAAITSLPSDSPAPPAVSVENPTLCL